MTCNDLSDRIRSWVWLYRNSPYPASTDPIITNYNGSAAEKWTKEMCAEVTHFEEPIELLWTSAGDELRMAVELAATDDRSRLRELHDRLAKVEKYIGVKNLYVKNKI